MKTFNINGKELTVILPDFDSLKDSIKQFRENYYEEGFVKESGYNCMLYKIYTDKHSTFNEVEEDVEDMLELIESIENNNDLLIEHIEKVRKKKNGLFWNKSGYCIKTLEACTEYFTDFTNAWSTPELRLDVINENECKLHLRYYTNTY